jgi:2-haloacid dehalogenase
MGYQWILFDADNTLFDFDRAAAEALRQTIEAHGHAFESHHVESYGAVNARYWQAFERGEIDQATLRVERFAEFLRSVSIHSVAARDFSVDYEVNLGGCSYLLEGAEAILETLRPHVEMALITNGLQNVQRPRLANSPIARFFADTIISEEVGAAKPDPRIFAIAFERMGSPEPSQVLIVGDSLSSDIKGGSDFGIDTCWYNPQRQPLDPEIPTTYQIETLHELAAICIPRSTRRAVTLDHTPGRT